jgi:3-oxoacyl-[acyl-carrier-protein] synthase-3
VVLSRVVGHGATRGRCVLIPARESVTLPVADREPATFARLWRTGIRHRCPPVSPWEMTIVPPLEVTPTPLDPFVTPPTRAAGIVALGRALPGAVVDNAPIAARVGVEPEWITRRTGIHRRRRIPDDQSLSDLAADAGRLALDAAGLRAQDVDAVLVATSSADDIVPQAAPIVAGRLGADRAMAWDVGLGCVGFLAGLQQGAALVESGRATNVLLIGADVMSRYTDHDDRQTAGLFGDGAGAAVLAPGGAGAVGPILLGADAQRDVLFIGREERVVRMAGAIVYRHAIDRMEEACRDLLERAGLAVDDVELVVAHQANGRIISALGDRLGLEPARVAHYVGELGNTSAASIPLALSLAEDEGRLPDEGHVVLTSFGGGFCWGAGLLTYGATGA